MPYVRTEHLAPVLNGWIEHSVWRRQDGGGTGALWR